jgi:hypothetical protein
MKAGANPEALAGLERARLLFAELRRAAPELVKAALEEIAAGQWRASLRAPGPFFGDYEQANHETEAGAVALLAGTVKAMAEKRFADLARALDAFDASEPGGDHKKAPRRTGRGRK